MDDFQDQDYWQSIILYGLNQATYKIALGKTLVSLARQGQSIIPWDVLSLEFFRQYQSRLSVSEPMPQQSNPSRRTLMEKVIRSHRMGLTSLDESIHVVGKEGFGDVVRRFHNIARFSDFQGKFYSFDFGKNIYLTDSLFNIAENVNGDIDDELNSRWSLLEGAFSIKAENYELANEVLDIYISKGTKRKDLTNNLVFLKGYQGNSCFYCSEVFSKDNIHVDHLLPRSVMNHDQVWNLVLAHEICNLSKSDKIVGPHFLEKLIVRNENIMGSNHPWKAKIAIDLGETKEKRKAALKKHYENTKTVLGKSYWGNDSHYNPSSDAFYKRLITKLNNKV